MCGTLKVFCFDLDKLAAGSEQHLFDLLTYREKERIVKYVNPLDRLQRACGRVILKRMLIDEGYAENVLQYIRLDQYFRPYIDHLIDFNISHADKQVVVAMSMNTRLGVDVEKVQVIDISNFDRALTGDEADRIKLSNDPIRYFYELWTKKEAVLKANGKGFHLPLSAISIGSDSASCETEVWKLQKMQVHSDYCCHLAFSGSQVIEQVTLEPSFLF